MQEWNKKALPDPAGDPAGVMKKWVWLTSALMGLVLALVAVFDVSILLILVPFAVIGILALYFFYPTWGIIISILLMSVKRLFSVVVGVLPLFTINRTLIIWVLICLLLHRFVLKTRNQFHPHRQNQIALLFCIWFTMCTLLALDKTYAFHIYPQLIGNILIFFLLYQLIDNQKQLAVLFLGYIALLAGSGFLSIIGNRLTGAKLFGSGMVFDAETSASIFRASGVAGMDPNHYAVVVVCFIFTLTILLWWRDLNQWHRLVIGVFIFGFLFMLTQTMSRTGMILFILASTFFLFKYWKRIGLRRIAIGGLALGLIFTGLVTEQVVDRFTSISEVKDLNLSEDHSISNRIGLTLMLPQLIAINPIFGVGPGNIAYLTSKAESRDYVGRNLKGLGFKSHNQYVGLIGETGVIGFSIFILLMGLCVRDLLVCRRLVAAQDGTFLWCLVEALTLIMPLLFLASATLDTAYNYAFWIILSLPVIIRRMLEREVGSSAANAPQEAILHPSPPALD